MENSELNFSGVGVSASVVSAIVSRAAEKVEGVASVGQKATASNLVSVFMNRSETVDGEAVSSYVEDNKLHTTVHLTVFYGYPFMKLAAAVRTAVASAVSSQIGAEVKAVDVCIDSIVFPKE